VYAHRWPFFYRFIILFVNAAVIITVVAYFNVVNRLCKYKKKKKKVPHRPRSVARELIPCTAL